MSPRLRVLRRQMVRQLSIHRNRKKELLVPAIPEDDKEGLGRLIRYLFRSPVSYRQLSYDEATGLVRCRSKRGGYRECHATEFLAVLAQHASVPLDGSPRPRQHVVTYAGHYANAAENLSLAPKKDDAEGETKGNAGGFRRYSWAELLALVWRVPRSSR